MLVPYVDIERYSGLWYQVARYPHFFQTDDCGESTAEYSLEPDGSVSVLNRCWKEEYGGEYSQQVRARAVRADDSGSRLRVTFYGLFTADYLVIGLDEKDYRWAVVTTPGKKTLWVLSRTPRLDEDIYAGIISNLAGLGFDESKIIRTSGQ